MDKVFCPHVPHSSECTGIHDERNCQAVDSRNNAGQRYRSVFPQNEERYDGFSPARQH